MAGAKRAAAPADLVAAGTSTSGQRMRSKPAKPTSGSEDAGGDPSSPPARKGRESASPSAGGQESSATGLSWPTLQPSAHVETGAGFVLGALFWAWVGLPFLKGGPSQVRDVLRAKFCNRGPDGGWLP